jgi:hypothetical protein
MDDAAYRRASALGDALVERGPVAVSARYDVGAGQIVVRLRSGLELRVDPSDVAGLGEASDEDLSAVAVEPPGLEIRWERLDASLFLPYLVEEKLGDGRWAGLIHARPDGRLASPIRATSLWRRGGRGRRSRKGRSAGALAS